MNNNAYISVIDKTSNEQIPIIDKTKLEQFRSDIDKYNPYNHWVSCKDCADFDECENKENCDGCLAGEEIHAAWEYHSANNVGLITVACSNCGHKQTGITKRCHICKAIMDEGKV